MASWIAVHKKTSRPAIIVSDTGKVKTSHMTSPTPFKQRLDTEVENLAPVSILVNPKPLEPNP